MDSENLHVFVILTLMFAPIVYDIVRLAYRVRVGQLPFKLLRRYLIRIAIVMAIIGSSILTLNHTNFLNYKSPMPFSSYDHISFKDFRGLEFFRKNLNGNRRFAYVVTSVEYDFSKEGVYVEAFFHPSRSFVFNRDAYSRELLRHELYHFRITELYARRIRSTISSMEDITEGKVDEVVEFYMAEERRFQQRYDLDTYHSYLLGQQKKYEAQIDSLLYSLRNNSDPIIERK